MEEKIKKILTDIPMSFEKVNGEIVIQATTTIEAIWKEAQKDLLEIMKNDGDLSLNTYIEYKENLK